MKTSLLLGLLLFINLALPDFAADQPLPEPVATSSTLDLSEMFMSSPWPPTFAMVTFLSETSIAVKECPTSTDSQECPLSVFRWENGDLKRAGHISQLEFHSNWSSVGATRQLLDSNEREVPRLQHMLEILRAVTTLGMAGPEDVNREVVSVFETAGRKSCFEWRRTFPPTYGRERSAAISPSGEFVAIATQNRLSIYRLPATCEGPTIPRSRGE